MDNREKYFFHNKSPASKIISQVFDLWSLYQHFFISLFIYLREINFLEGSMIPF